MTAARHRLHIHSIESVGAVEDGDSPEAQIVLWKSKAKTAQVRPAGRGLGSPAAWGTVLDRIAADKIAETQVTKTKTQEATVAPRNAEIAPAGTVRGKVDALALEMVEKGEAPNLAQARPMVWRQHPELVAKSRQETSGPVASTQGKSITDRIREVVDEATRRAAWQPLLEGWGDGQTRGQIISKVRSEVWHTPDGEELRDLERAYGAKPYTPATSSEIRKSRGGDRYARALNLLDSGIWAG